MKQSTIYLAADHAGFELKEKIKSELKKKNLLIIDLSPKFMANDDYPKQGIKLAKQIAKTENAKGLAFCGSGIGITMATNRIKGVRAFDAFNTKIVKLAREHNDANIMAMSGWDTSVKSALKLIDVFLNTNFSGSERHRRRIKQLG